MKISPIALTNRFRNVLLTFAVVFAFMFLLPQSAHAVTPPTFSLNTGIYGQNQTLTMTATGGASIYYTTNGTTPTTGSTLYSSPITISTSEEVQAIAYISPNSSTVTSAYYEIDPSANSIPTTGLLLWLRSDFELAQTSGKVTSWTDGSGNVVVASQGTGADQPTVVNNACNGWPAIAFNGTSDYLTMPAGFTNLASGFSLFAIAQPTTSSTVTVFQLGNTGPANTVGMETNGTTFTLQSYNGSTASTLTSSASTVTVNNYQLLQGTQSGSATGVLTVNAAPAGSGTLGNTTNISRTASTIGANAAASAFFKGNIVELIVYSGQVTASQAASIQAYALNRYQMFNVNSTPTPILSLPTSTLTAPTQVAISARPSATVYITVDGSTPTTSSPVYSGPVQVNCTQTVKAIAVINGISSSVASATYTLNSTQWPAPSTTDATSLQMNIQVPQTGISP